TPSPASCRGPRAMTFRTLKTGTAPSTGPAQASVNSGPVIARRPTAPEHLNRADRKGDRGDTPRPPFTGRRRNEKDVNREPHFADRYRWYCAKRIRPKTSSAGLARSRRLLSARVLS